MSLQSIGLSKLLNMMYADRSQRRSMLREDIRSVMKKEAGEGSGGGGDFYLPFWSDVKSHVAGTADLRVATAERIEANSRRQRLYPELRDGFLMWWEQKRRFRNEPFRVIEDRVKARLDISGLGAVKIENTFAIVVGDDGPRILYPYFYEAPSLSAEAARLGLWAMSSCIKDYAPADLRLLDIIAGRSFSITDTPLQGTEEGLFVENYRQLVAEWAELRLEYDGR